MLKKESVQGTNYYFDPNIERLRYTPYRKANRKKAELSYMEGGEFSKYPLHIIVETSSKCNMSCKFCNRQVMGRPQQNMPLKTFKKVADQAAEMGVFSLSLYCLGEPMLNLDLPKMIRYAKDLGIPYVDVSTNGMIGFNSLLKTGLNEVIVSLDGFADTHEKLRKGADWNRIVENIDDFMATRKSNKIAFPILRVQIIDLPETHKIIPKFIKFWQRKKIKPDVIYVKRLETMAQNLGNINIDEKALKAKLSRRKPCKQLFFVMTVNSNGDIAGCCHDPRGLSVLGNIKNKSLKDCWDTTYDMRRNHISGEYNDFGGLCKNCLDHSW